MLNLNQKSKRFALAALAFSVSAAVQAGPVDTAIDVTKKIDRAAAETQSQVDTLSDATIEASAEYKAALEQVERLKAYNANLADQVKSQTAEMDVKKKELAEIDTTKVGVVPLLGQMIDALEAFIKEDVPFQMEERNKRIASLRDMMKRADVSVSEKFRRVMEAYQVESDYGTNVESYQDQITGADGQAQTVDFLKMGRTILVYQTLDGKFSAYWDKKAKQFVELNANEYRIAVREGMRIARKQSAPDVIKMPVQAAEIAQ
ncbi:MAG: DUF3450 domain-containing protein [Gammaproteobacteria bacterium]|nr:DUF3450 domain-containing protein [Gammaproteobacteria bacterium]